MSLRILSRNFLRSKTVPLTAFRFYSAEKRYAATHEWVQIENGVGTIGISEHAAQSLGDVVYVEGSEPGESIEAGEPCGTVESVKAASDIIAPISGEVLSVNSDVTAKPNLINKSPEGQGWVLKVQISAEAEEEFKNLMDLETYKSKLEDLDH